MPQRTIFLSRLIGLYCVIVGLAMFTGGEAYKFKLSALLHNAPVLLLAGMIAVALGLAMILTHNIWSGGALPVVVTLVGWTALLKGAIFLWLRPGDADGYFAALHVEQLYYVYAGITLVLGVYLAYGGFKQTAGT